MTSEDRLRDLLRDGEPPVGPGSFDDVRARARRRARRGRALVAGGLALVVALAAAVALPLLDDDEPPQQVIAEPGRTTSTVPATTIPVTSEPVGIWPFVTAAEADDKGIELPFNPTDAEATARAFVTAFTPGMGPATATETIDGRRSSVALRVRNRTSVVELRKLGTSDRWTVIAVEADGLVLDDAAVGARSVRVTGRATAFEGTVVVSVLDRGRPPTPLGRAPLTGEQGDLRTFSGEVPFDSSAADLGVVVAVTESAEDGTVEQVAALPVRFAEAPSSPLVAVINRDVVDDPDEQDVVVLAEDGSVERVLLEGFSTVEGGVLDAEVTPDGRAVLVAVSTSACTAEIRSIPLDGSAPRSLGPGHRLSVSPDGRRLAVAYDVDCDGRDELDVRPLSGSEGGGTAVEGQIAMLTWADDDTVVYDIRGQDGGALIVRDVASGRERALDDRWSLPLARAEGALQVLVVERGDTAYLGNVVPATGRLLGAGAEVPADVVDHTLVDGNPYWVTRDGVLHGFDRVLRRDVALVAS